MIELTYQDFNNNSLKVLREKTAFAAGMSANAYRGVTAIGSAVVVKVNKLQADYSREILALRKLNKIYKDGPFVTLLGVGSSFLVLEQLGQPLEMSASKDIRFNHIVTVSRDILNGVIWMHDVRVAHGDLHPRNILLSKNGIKFIDFERASVPEIKDNSFLGNALFDIQNIARTALYMMSRVPLEKQAQIVDFDGIVHKKTQSDEKTGLFMLFYFKCLSCRDLNICPQLNDLLMQMIKPQQL